MKKLLPFSLFIFLSSCSILSQHTSNHLELVSAKHESYSLPKSIHRTHIITLDSVSEINTAALAFADSSAANFISPATIPAKQLPMQNSPYYIAASTYNTPIDTLNWEKDTRPINALALSGFIIGVTGILLTFYLVGILLGIAALIMGIIALSQLKKNRDQKGRTLAIATIAVGIVDILLPIAIIALVLYTLR